MNSRNRIPFRARGGGLLAAIALVALGAIPSRVWPADALRGKATYETRCIACHDRSVHQRSPRAAASFAEVRAAVELWSREAGGAWTTQEIDDVAVYLNQRYYGYPCPADVCRREQAMSRHER